MAHLIRAIQKSITHTPRTTTMKKFVNKAEHMLDPRSSSKHGSDYGSKTSDAYNSDTRTSGSNYRQDPFDSSRSSGYDSTRGTDYESSRGHHMRSSEDYNSYGSRSGGLGRDEISTGNEESYASSEGPNAGYMPSGRPRHEFRTPHTMRSDMPSTMRGANIDTNPRHIEFSGNGEGLSARPEAVGKTFGGAGKKLGGYGGGSTRL